MDGSCFDMVEDSVKRWKVAAEQGDAEAQARLGNCYYRGEGVDLIGLVDFKVERHVVYGDVSRGQPFESFGVRIIWRRYVVLRIGVAWL